MPKQSDDLTRERDESQETKKSGLKIPVPTKEKVSGQFGRAARKRSDEGKRQPPSDSGKQ
jgi:hypothetical protein